MLKEKLIISGDSMNYITASFTLLLSTLKIPKLRSQPSQLNMNVWEWEPGINHFPGSPSNSYVQQNLGTKRH